MKEFKFTINGSQYSVNINNVEGNIADLEVNGTPYQVEIDKELKQVKTPKLVRPAAIPSTDAHPSIARTQSPGVATAGAIKSPLPGVVLELFVSVGDQVKMGQKLLVLEAMKMENNIDSDKEGTVKEIKIGKGGSVLEGDVLIIIG